MERIILNNFGNGGLIIEILILIYFINKITPIFKDINSLIVGWFNLDNNKRIKVLSDNLDSIKGNNSVLIDVIKYEIDDLIYSNLTGYSWERDKQLIFLEFYNKIKSEMSLKRFKLLYYNCSIDEAKVVSIKINFNMKVD